MSGECCETDASNEFKTTEVKEDLSNDSGDNGSLDQHNEDVKLHEMGEALEIAENRCNTLKEQLDQMRHLYRERSNLEQTNNKNGGLELQNAKPTLKQPILRQNSEAISTDNSGAAVLTINNILNGITNSINRLSELHTYIEPETSHSNIRKKSKHTKTQENEFVSEKCTPRCSASRSSSWIFNDKKKDPKKRTKRSKPVYESGSLTHIKKPGVRTKVNAVKEEASTMSVKNRKKAKKITKPSRRPPLRRPGFNSTLSSNHLVEIYHNSAVDYADSEEMIHAEPGQENHKTRMRSTHIDLRNKYSRKEVQMPTISTTDCKEEEDTSPSGNRPDAYRSLSPIKEQEPIIEVLQQQDSQYPTRYFYNRSYQSPTISSKMKQVARGYFRNFSCKSIPFCAAKSTTPSHNIGINIQQVMSIIKGRQSTHGISPTLAHNIGVAAERLNNNSFSALVSSFGSHFPCTQQMPCPMQCSVNYQQLQEMAAEVPLDEALDVEGQIECEKNKIEIEITNRKSQEAISWTIDPNNHNNCTCIKASGVGFHDVVDKYHNYVPPPANLIQSSIYNLQQSMYSQKVQKHSSKKYDHIRSVYAQYNESNRKGKKESFCELSTLDGTSRLPLQGKEKILKGVLINLHEEFQSLSDKYDVLSKIVEDEKHSNQDNVEKMESLEKKLNEKELEIQMVMSLYTEVVNLKAQVKALKDKVGMSTAILDTQKHRMKMYQRFQMQQHPQQAQDQAFSGSNNTNNPHTAYQQYYNPKVRETKANAALHLTKLLRQIQAYREVCRTGGK